MPKLIPTLIIALFLFSCKKEDDAQQKKKVPDFYISFKIADSNYVYRVGDQYTYANEGSVSYGFGTNRIITYTPRTSIGTPDNANKMLVGFSFHLETTECISCNREQEMASYGNALFSVGEKFVGYTGFNQDVTLPYDIYSPDGVAVYWRSQEDKYFTSTADHQPQGSFFTIDTVINESYESTYNSWLNYEKIIIGRFKCRVYKPSDKKVYKDLVEGRFRMPAWKKQH